VGVQKLIVFGEGKIADVLVDYFRRDSEYEIVAFTCEASYASSIEHRGLPLVPFNEVVNRFPPDRHLMHIAVGYHDLNRVRERLFLEAKIMGYHLASFVSSRSWPGRGLACGENCFIADGVSVEPGAHIGRNVALWSNVVVGHHATIDDHCWLAAGTVVGGSAVLEARCFAALNVTVGNEVTVGADSFLGARALVTKSLPPKSVLIERDTERLRLDSEQFLRISKLR
jgi:sugar O-acyltransferase (sialic acid O-acetyltransferase NeuD family)